jgi:hypothetical protein
MVKIAYQKRRTNPSPTLFFVSKQSIRTGRNTGKKAARRRFREKKRQKLKKVKKSEFFSLFLAQK